MRCLDRRKFLGELAAAGATALISGSTFSGQSRPAANTGKINIHHHLTAPAYVKFLSENKVRDLGGEFSMKNDNERLSQAYTLFARRLAFPGLPPAWIVGISKFDISEGNTPAYEGPMFSNSDSRRL